MNTLTNMANFLKTLLFLAPVFMPIIVIGSMFGLIGAVIGLMISFIVCILVMLNMDRIILRLFKAHAALPEGFSNINEKVLMLSKNAGVAIPSIYITELPLPGSLVIGKGPDKTRLIVPKRLLNLLIDEEFEAMLAHNIVQINNTIRLRTLALLIAGLLTMAASAMHWGAVFTGFGEYDDPAPKLFGIFMMGLVAAPAATILETVAKNGYDAKAVALSGNSDALISAIERLEDNNVSGYPFLGYFCLVDPQKETFFENLFQTHQSREKRIKNLAIIGDDA